MGCMIGNELEMLENLFATHLSCLYRMHSCVGVMQCQPFIIKLEGYLKVFMVHKWVHRS